MSSSDPTVTVTFTADEYAAVTEQAAQRGIPIDDFVRQAAAQRANDGKMKDALLQEIADRRGQSLEEFLRPGFVIDTDDEVDAELDRRLAAAELSDAEKDARARQAAQECGVEYTDEIRALGQALWAKIAAHRDNSIDAEPDRHMNDAHGTQAEPETDR
ncbi:hypothetical protein ACFWRG_29905 [Micromonospora tulbaghiae]|uniref:Ribbon-helix-helix protein CopG domain-containing protein n=1 Tax=Streptomyces bacillaris TaxID=68179 RepID=A0ABW6E3S0_9ACTN|nr:hypothetical protein [Streptomyces nanshensis]